MDASNVKIRVLNSGEENRIFRLSEAIPHKGFWGEKSIGLRSRRDFDRLVGSCNREPSRARWLLATHRDRPTAFAIVSIMDYRRRVLGKRLGYDPECAFVMGFAQVEDDPAVASRLVGSVREFLRDVGLGQAIYPAVDLHAFTSIQIGVGDLQGLSWLRGIGLEPWDLRYRMQLDLEGVRSLDQDDLVGTLSDRLGLSFQTFDSSIQAIRSVDWVEGAPRAPLDLHTQSVAGDIDWDMMEDGCADIGIYVKEIWRGQGIGTALLGSCLKTLQEKGVRQALVSVDGNNPGALKLYRKFGFQPDLDHTTLYMTIRIRDKGGPVGA